MTMRILLFLCLLPLLPASAQRPPVYVVLFTHIEDNTPAAEIGTPQARTQYLAMRNGLLDMSSLARSYGMTWVFQPDWKLLLACLAYEDSVVTRNTGGKNILRYLREDRGVPIDAHSHEKLGYNYTDVAHLLDSLGVGGSTVIGGHVWDPTLPQFQQWDRFRVPVAGTRFPWARWRGDILMGSGTPNHTNDPHPSGVWRPKDRNAYWQDDPAGNIACVGQFTGDVPGVKELARLAASGAIDSSDILTASIHILPMSITVPAGLRAIEDTILKPLADLRGRGEVELTDFTSLVEIWRTRFRSKAHLHNVTAPGAGPIGTFVPSDAGGSQGIYVEIEVPDTARFSDGAPVVVHIAGGWAPEGISIARDAVTPGFIVIRYNFPGGGSGAKASGGLYDDRGELSIRATRDVIRFAMGTIPDRNGAYLRDLTGSVIPLAGNVGLCGWSNGGNATLTTAGRFGDSLTGLAWIVNWESPVGDGMPGVEAGGNRNPNPAYDAVNGTWDLRTLAYNDTIVVSRPGLPVVRGGLYFDLDGNGRPESGKDWFLSPYVFRPGAVKTYYSERIRSEAERRALIPGSAPAHIATLTETRDFWRWRNASLSLPLVVEKHPDLLFIAAASDTDHVQGAADHPHVLIQYNGLIDARARFVRLNADRVYCELAGGRPYPQAPDNDAFHPFTRLDIGTGLVPDGARNIPDAIYVSAAIQELADRIRYRHLARNLDAVISAVSSADSPSSPGNGGFDLRLSTHPAGSDTRIRVVSPVDGPVRVQIHDLAGRLRATVVDARVTRGITEFPLPQLVPGAYFVSLHSDATRVTRPYVQF